MILLVLAWGVLVHIGLFLLAVEGYKGPAGAGAVNSVLPGELGVLALKVAKIHLQITSLGKP